MVLCIAACTQVAMAQNTVESIRARYAAIKDYIATHVEDNANDGATWAEYYHLEVRQYLPATGGHKEDTYLYWEEREEDRVYPSHYLLFATKKYNFSAMQYYEEYLFDKDGKVAFIYCRDPYFSVDEQTPSTECELRFYLNKGKLLKVIIKKRANENEQFKQVYDGPTLKKEYLPFFNNYMDSAAKLSRLFTEIEKNSYDYSE